MSLQNGIVLVCVREMDSKTLSGRNEHDGYPETAAKRHRFSDFAWAEASVLETAMPTKTKQSTQYWFRVVASSQEKENNVDFDGASFRTLRIKHYPALSILLSLATHM